MDQLKLPVLRSDKFSVSLKIGGVVRKIFQIGFHSGKVSGNTYCFVNFPYFSQSKGLLSRATFIANRKYLSTISLLPEGKTTSHLVKYNHPLDGMSHFSGDGKIVSSIKNQSKRLDVSHGHMFTIQIQGLDDFVLREVKRLNHKIVDLDFDVGNVKLEAFKFIGRWYKATELKGTIANKTKLEPKFAFRDPDGFIRETGFVVSPPIESPLSEHVLLISCQSISKIDETRKSVFTFIGGFDEKNVLNEDLHFLTCVYPASDYDKLMGKLGSVDFNPK